MTCRALLDHLCFGSTAVTFLKGSPASRLSTRRTGIRNIVSHSEAAFKPAKVAVVTKTTRYEFEQQRYRFAELSEDDLKQLVRVAIVNQVLKWIVLEYHS